MGSLVSRYLLEVDYNDIKIGEYDKLMKVFTLDGVHHGSPLQNFIQILSNLKNLKKDFKGITYLEIPGGNKENEKSLLLSFFQILYVGFTRGFEEVILTTDFINLASEELISIIRDYPQIMSVFVNTGNIDPFKGGRSFVYDNQEYLDIISKNEFNNLSKDVFKENEALNLFNNNYKFFDKFITISSYIENIEIKSIPNEKVIDSVSLGILNKIMKNISKGADKEEIENDGLVNVYSQEALNTGDKNVIWKYNNMNHLEITMNSTVCKDILSYIISNK